MNRYLAALLPMFALSMIAAAPLTRAPAVRFSVVVKRTASGWSAACEVGCTAQWVGTLNCWNGNHCDARVNERGLAILPTDTDANTRYSFTVEERQGGVVATNQIGALWSEFSWKCEKLPCPARVTDRTVAMVRPAK